MKATKKEVLEFLKVFGTKVLAEEPEGYCELMMDNHICIKYLRVEYYVPENNMFYTQWQSDLVDMLKDKYHV